MPPFVHPSLKQITLSGVLGALADPIRQLIVKTLLEEGDRLSCCKSVKCRKIAKSTISNHFRILREAGIIHTSKQGVENLNTVRADDLETKFPGLLTTILKYVEWPK